MAQYKLLVRTLSPVHIGNGNELRLGFDFGILNGNTYRFHIDNILEKYYDPRQPYRLPKDMLYQNDYSNPTFFRYVVKGAPISRKNDARLRECIKDVHDRPYIPGSSIKGAIRTALAVEMLREKNLKLEDLIQIHNSPKKADDQVEKILFGKDPNNDFLKALQVSDAVLEKKDQNPGAKIYIGNISPVTWKSSDSNVPIEVECIKSQTNFNAALKIDDYLIRELFPHEETTLGSLMKIINRFSTRRLQLLLSWYEQAESCGKVKELIKRLLNLCDRLNDDMAFLQIGFGTGWDGITYGELLQSDEIWFERMVSALRLQRRRSNRLSGDSFPKSRKVEFINKVPNNPLGWVLLNRDCG